MPLALRDPITAGAAAPPLGGARHIMAATASTGPGGGTHPRRGEPRAGARLIEVKR